MVSLLLDLYSRKSFGQTSDGFQFQDFFKVVIENIAEFDQTTQIKRLRQEFWEFPKNIGWKIPANVLKYVITTDSTTSSAAATTTTNVTMTPNRRRGSEASSYNNDNICNNNNTSKVLPLHIVTDDKDSHTTTEGTTNIANAAVGSPFPINTTATAAVQTSSSLHQNSNIPVLSQTLSGVADVNFAVPSDAVHGNLLEAINTALNILDKHYLDRDLVRTNNSIVTISAGVGIFKVKPNLSQITKQRMLDNAFVLEFISLASRPPLHTVPLFLVDCRSDGVKDFYETPHWMRVSYIDCKAPNR